MAEIRKRVKKNGKPTFTAIVRITGHPTCSKTFSKVTDAKEWASRTEIEIRDSINFPKRKAQKYTISFIIDDFIENELPKKKASAQAEFKMVLNWYKKEIGSYYLSSVTNEMLINCRNKLEHKHKEIPIRNKNKNNLEPRISDQLLSNATINKYLTYMRVVFQYYVEKDVIDINPMSKVKKLTVDNTRKRFLEPKEIKKLLDTCKNVDYELYLCVLIALLTGARKSEVLHLTWANVDLEHKMFYFLNTKNGDDRGEPMHEWLYTELKKYKNQNKVRRLKNDYLFMTPDGKPKESLIGKLFPKVVNKCGIEDFRFHDLRHTQASWQAMSGVSQPITQKTLGHKSPAMTNRYSHLRDENLRLTINEVGNVMLKEFLQEENKEGK